MICPDCNSEYREGFTRCVDCDIDLIEIPLPEPEVNLVKIYEGGNPAVLPLIESLLRDADIEFLARGQAVQELFALGSFGAGGGSNTSGPVELWVREDDAEAAKALIENPPEPDEVG
ncbi:MAG TPA: DUF2007 domain-containing protein [Thermoanaerobaculia bacterium]|nr:DUF2007 domain-containing protein [Thermoanaerobaculia bacterium]